MEEAGMRKHSLVFEDCNVYTVFPRIQQTDAIAISDGRIAALGRDARLSPSSWPRVSLRGSTVLPGLIDAHLHLAGAANRRLRLQLDNSSGIDGILSQVKRWICTHSDTSWIIGNGWDESMWERPILPTRDMLDEVTGATPAVLFRRDGHSAWLNSAAFERVTLDESLPAPFIPRDEYGKFAGIIRETALTVLSPQLPRVTDDDLIGAIVTLQDEILSYGITGVHTFETESRQRILHRARKNDQLTLRTYLSIEHVSLEELSEASYRENIQGYKLYLDGSLGSHTAFTVEPDSSHSCGYPVMETEALDRAVENALALDLDVLVHAIGDGAVRMALDAYERHIPAFPERVVRIEHAQLIHPDDLNRLNMPNLVISIQPCHLLNDIELAERLWTSQLPWSYAYESMRKSGARLVMGTDFPIEPINPWRNIFIAMHRGITRDSPWRPIECLTWEQILYSYTKMPALSARWHDVGSLEPGRSATLIAVSEDPRELSSPDQTVHFTMIDGEIVYSNGFVNF